MKYTSRLQRVAFALVLFSAPGCGGDSPPPMAVADTYVGSGVWNFGGPLEWLQSPGTVVADELVDNLADAISTRFTRNATRDAVRDTFHRPIRNYVNQSLGAVGNVAVALEFVATLMTRVHVDMRLNILSVEPLRGVNELVRITTLADLVENEKLEIDLTGPIQVRGPFDGTVKLGGALVIEPHRLLVSYGPLIDFATEKKFGFPAYTRVSEFQEQLDCDALTEQVLGIASSVSVAGVDVDVPTGRVVDACTDAKAIFGQALATLGLPTPLEFSGELEARRGPVGFYDLEPTSFAGRFLFLDDSLPFDTNIRFLAADDANAITQTGFFGF